MSTKQQKVRILAYTVYIDGEPHLAGEELELPAAQAKALIEAGDAEKAK